MGRRVYLPAGSTENSERVFRRVAPENTHGQRARSGPAGSPPAVPTTTGTVTPWQRINAACLGAPASGLQRNVPLFHRGDGALPNHTANPVDPVKSSHDLSHLKVTVFTTPHTALFCARVTGARACGQRRLRFLPGNRNWSDRDLCAPPYRLHLRIPITSHMHQ